VDSGQWSVASGQGGIHCKGRGIFQCRGVGNDKNSGEDTPASQKGAFLYDSGQLFPAIDYGRRVSSRSLRIFPRKERIDVMSEDQLRTQLYDSFKNRAIVYYLIYDELRAELGADRAEELLSRAIYRRGELQGQEKFARFAPYDLAGLKSAFLDGIPDNAKMFRPEILRSDAEGLDIKFHACPLRDAWLETGLPEEDVATLCRIASQVDDGTFVGAGFQFNADTWQPGGEGCCCLHIRRGP
jgi:hypothetical protein